MDELCDFRKCDNCRDVIPQHYGELCGDCQEAKYIKEHGPIPKYYQWTCRRCGAVYTSETPECPCSYDPPPTNPQEG